MNMEIYALMENIPYRQGFAAEHGLSLYIKTARHRILFDTGQSAAFADNAGLLGLDLGNVDMLVLSHGHYDHGGGIRRFLELNDCAPVYLSEYAFGAYYHGAKKYIGIDPSLEGSSRMVKVKDSLEIGEGLTLYSCNGRSCRCPVDDAGLTEKKDGVFLPDSFLHEQYLVIRENGIKTVISGCSHKGILNIIEWFRPDILVGGFHFMGQEISEAGNERLDRAAETLLQYDTVYYTCHCTGETQYRYLKEKMGDRLHYLASGQKITL